MPKGFPDTGSLKTCNFCGRKKNRKKEFYLSRNRYSPYCKECWKQITRIQKLKNYDPKKARKRYERRKAKPGFFKEEHEKFKKLYPEKYKARYTLRNAVRYGKIKKAPCMMCGDKKAHGHHEDYTKPLDVIWLCRKHHMEIHRKPNLIKSRCAISAIKERGV